jgi:transcriptional regulator with XRE-family HTH domain
MDIGNSIKLIRKKLGISQIELAEKCNISQTSLCHIETGAKRPSTKTLKKLCGVLQVPESVIYLLAIEHTDIPENKRKIYEIVYPSIRSLVLHIVDDEHVSLLS